MRKTNLLSFANILRDLAAVGTLLSIVGCGGGSNSGGSIAPPMATVSVKTNQTIPNHPHMIDYYIPSNATSAVVFLHGGGGTKEGLEYSLGIKADSTAADYYMSSSGQGWLSNEQVIAVFPQGQTVAGSNWTWSNYVMNSGVDDVKFLQDLVASLKSSSSLPHVTKIYLVGHSNGGMMANRMWCESPDTFDGYAALAGPPSVHLDPGTGTHPCLPSTIKPYLGIVGDHDTVLQTAGEANSHEWTINPILLVKPAAWLDPIPQVLNDELFFSKRVSLKCDGTIGSPTVSGQITTYSDCSGSLKLEIIAQATVSGKPSGGDHCLLTLSEPCVTTLTGDTGLDLKTDAVTFLKRVLSARSDKSLHSISNLHAGRNV
jgi:poly(3-hydroxybutyrate) depolymerase